MKDNISGIIAILASFQLLFVAFFLFTHRKGNRNNNRLLGLIFLLFAMSLGDFALRISGVEFNYPAIHLLDDGFFFLYGPLLYFYVRRVVYVDLRWRARDLLHLLPFTAYCMFLAYGLIVMDLEEQQRLTQNIDTVSLPGWIYLLGISVYIYTLTYLWLAYRTVNTYRSIIKTRFSSLEKINLNWLRFIIHSFLAITFIAMIHNVIPVFGNIVFLYISLIILLIFTFFFINRVLVKALKQPEIFAGIPWKEAGEKYTGSNLTEDEIEDHHRKLLSILENEQMYLNPDLTMQDLSERMQLSTKAISQVINQSSGKNFFDFINTFRCEEAKKLMKTSDPRVTILEILYEAGFNSKSSFNKEFKKLTGSTPTEYRKSL